MNPPSDDQGSLSRVATWAAHPFSSNMDALNWILWLGLILCAAWMWTRLIHHFLD